MSAAAFLARLERTTLITLAVLTAGAYVWRPAQPRLALGIAGGGVLIGLSYWAIRGAVDTFVASAIQAEKRPGSRTLALVKFFTRHAILALAAYVMMARLDLHPVGMLVGVSTPAVAAALEATRSRRR